MKIVVTGSKNIGKSPNYRTKLEKVDEYEPGELAKQNYQRKIDELIKQGCSYYRS